MKKKTIVISIFFLLVFTGIGVWLSYRETPKQTFITYKDFGLTSAEKQGYMDRINESVRKLEELGSKATKEDVYKLNLNIGAQYYGLGEYAKAKEFYYKSATALPENATSWAELYVVENAMTDYENARKHLRRAIELNWSEPQYWRWLIDLEQEHFNNTNEQLEALYIDALKHTGESIDIITYYAKFLENKKQDLPGAIAQWRKAVEKNSKQEADYNVEIQRIQNKVK